MKQIGLSWTTPLGVPRFPKPLPSPSTPHERRLRGLRFVPRGTVLEAYRAKTVPVVTVG